MNGDPMSKEMFKLWKSSWDSYLKALDAVSDQGEKILELMLKQSDEVQVEGKKLIKEWATNAKELQGKYRSSVEDAVKKLEEMIEK